tara:strand:+ start:117 stop:287 length:171 start_codon:yes stop_codon:yes gene_type:complete
MAKPTVTSLASRVDKLEAVSEERFLETINRIKRLETIIIATGGATIVLLLNIVIDG